MGLFDKIKDNAKTISIRALEDEVDTRSVKSTTLIKPDPTAIKSSLPAEDNDAISADNIDDKKSVDEVTTPKSETTPDKSGSQTVGVKETAPTRKSKVTEMSKAEHARQKKEKEREKAKQEAKERLAKSYVPSYKSATSKSQSEKSTSNQAIKDNESKITKTPARRSQQVDIIDVMSSRPSASKSSLTFARERAAMSVLASQRKLNGTVAIYTSSHMNFRVKVYVDRIEYSGSFGKNILPISKVAWVKLRHKGTGVVIETVDNKKVVMVVKPVDRLDFTDAIFKAQAIQPKRKKFKDTQTVRIDQLDQLSEGLDELEKLAKLLDKGILTRDEFDSKKKQILGL